MKDAERMIAMLQWTLQNQPEPNSLEDPAALFSTDRAAEAVEKGQPLHAHDIRILLRSPAARFKLHMAIQARKSKRLLRWRELDLEEIIQLRAAADLEVSPVSVSNRDFTLTVLPLDQQGKQWMLHLKLSAHRANDLEGIAIKIVDDQGRLWMEGFPDSDGELTSSWTFDGSPTQSLASHRLHIRPA